MAARRRRPRAGHGQDRQRRSQGVGWLVWGTAAAGDGLAGGDAEDGTVLGLAGVAGAGERLARGERDGLGEPESVGLGDPVGAGDLVGAVVAGVVGLDVGFVAGRLAPDSPGPGRTRT